VIGISTCDAERFNALVELTQRSEDVGKDYRQALHAVGFRITAQMDDEGLVVAGKSPGKLGGMTADSRGPREGAKPQ